MARVLDIGPWTTSPGEPLRQGRFRSRLRDERIAAWLGASLAVLFSVCFLTGLYSHLQQHPQSWAPIPPRPAGLYRVTQGIHVATGIASLPALVAKLWVVWPRFLSFPPVRSAGHLVERLGLLPLVGGGVFMVFSGVANIAQWYPWPFSFTASHFWMAWVTMGALVTHAGAKWATTRRAFRRPPERGSAGAATPGVVGGLVADPSPAATGGLSRRGFLGAVAATSGVLTLVTVGQTFPPLRRLALLAPRDPAEGPQGYPVNRGAENAGVIAAATSPDYRLTVTGRVARPLSLGAADLAALADHEARLPIACVEGWSYSARWRGVRLADLLHQAGAEADRTVRLESLEARGAYRSSTLSASQAADRDTLLATHLGGEPLSIDHGAPCRLIAPDRAGVLQTKWVGSVVVE